MGEPRKFKSHPNLGALIHNTRKAKGLTLEQVSTRIDTTKSYLCEIESGVSPAPGFVLICLLSDVLRIPITHLKDAALTPQRNMETDRHEDDTDNGW